MSNTRSISVRIEGVEKESFLVGLERNIFFPRYKEFGAICIRARQSTITLAAAGTVRIAGKFWSELLCKADDSYSLLSAHICCAYQVD